MVERALKLCRDDCGPRFTAVQVIKEGLTYLLTELSRPQAEKQLEEPQKVPQ